MENGNNLIHSFQHTEREGGNYSGLTKREYFAAMAMQGMLANNLMIDNIDDGSLNIISQAAARASDALLLALEKSK